MALEAVVLVKLGRNEPSSPVNLNKRTALNSTEGSVYSMFELAKRQMNRSATKRFGVLDPASEHQQITGLLKSFNEKSIDFLNFANKAADQLQLQLDDSETPFSTVFLFAQETILGQTYVYGFWLPLSEAILEGSDLEPYRVEVIEPSKVEYAFRLHVEQWLSGESSEYLTVLAGRGSKDISDAFKRFCNFCEGIDLTKQTKEFLSIVEDYSEELPEEESKALKSDIIEYCIEQNKIGHPVVVEQISEQINPAEPKKFETYVAQRQELPRKEIHTDRRALKRYVRYFGRDSSLSINFSSERLGDDITYQGESGVLTIHKVPKSLKIQLSGFYDKTEQ